MSFRSTVLGIAKNSSILFFQQLLTWGSTFLLMLFLPRYLGPVEYGRLFLAGAVTEIFRILVGYGGHYLVTKEVSRDPLHTSRVLVDAAAFRTVLGFFSIFAILALTFIVDYPDDVRIIIMISALSLLWQGASIALYASFQGREMMQYTSYAAVAERIFTSIACVAALLLGANVIVVAIIMVVGGLLSFLVLAGNARKIIDRIPPVNWADVRRQVKTGVPYFLYAVFSTIYYRIDSLMLSKMTPEEVVGWYGGAYRLFDVLNFLPYILSMAVYPALSRLWSDAQDTHRRTMQKSMEVVLIAGMAIAVSAIFLAKDLVAMLYGTEGYAQSVVVLQALSAGLLFLYVDMVVGTTLLASDRQKQLSKISLSAIAVNILLNLVLIPRFQEAWGNGGIGAAIATAITELYVMVFALSVMPKGIFAGFRFQVIPKSACAGVAMAAVYWALSSMHVHWAIQAVAAIAAYIGVVLLIKGLEPTDVQAIKSAIQELPGRLRPGFAEEQGRDLSGTP
jgi:O-antigen/teichoic acid export membrane protein